MGPRGQLFQHVFLVSWIVLSPRSIFSLLQYLPRYRPWQNLGSLVSPCLFECLSDAELALKDLQGSPRPRPYGKRIQVGNSKGCLSHKPQTFPSPLYLLHGAHLLAQPLHTCPSLCISPLLLYLSAQGGQGPHPIQLCIPGQAVMFRGYVWNGYLKKSIK